MTRARAAPAQWLWVAPLVLALAVLACTAWAYLSSAYAYADNGDGLYLYPGERLAQGATLYREAVATQPPVVYLLAALVFKAGWGVPGIRLLSVLMRALCVALVYLLGARMFARRIVGGMAALLYALLPIGLTWDHWDNSNSPLTLVALLSAYALVRLSPRAAVVSGLLAALALFTKDLYLPLLAATLLYLWRVRRALLAPYLTALLIGVALLSGVLVVYGGAGAWRDAFLGQDSSPLNGDWLVASLAYVASLEGGLLVVAVVGALVCLCPSPPAHKANQGANDTGAVLFAPYLLAGSVAVLLATLKEGTFGTVFALAEPAVALLAAFTIVRAVQAIRAHGRRGPLWAGVLALACVSCFDLISPDRGALFPSVASDVNGAMVRDTAALIRRHAAPGTVVLVPPYYAVLTGTRLPYDVSDTYILARRANRGDPLAVAWVRGMARGVAHGRYPIVIVDRHIALFAPVMAALPRAYHPIYADTLPPSVQSVVWLPGRAGSGRSR